MKIIKKFRIHTLGLKYRAEKHPDSRAIMFDTKNINSRKIKDLIVAIDSLKACSEVVRLYGKLEEGWAILFKICDLIYERLQMLRYEPVQFWEAFH